MPKNSYLLTEEGLEKVNARFVEICEKSFPSKEEMGLCVDLDSDTIRKLLRRTSGVNRGTLERLCNGLGWDWESELKENFHYELQEQGVSISDPSRSQQGADVQHSGAADDVEVSSHFYVERVPYEAQCYEAILQPGALIRIKAPEQMGQTWFLQSIIRRVRELDYRHLTFDFHLLNGNDFSEVQRFFQSFCVGVTLELGLPDRLDDYWNNKLTYNYNSTVYFQEYLLAKIDSPLVLVLKHVDSVFEHQVIAIDFCNLLRSWHDKARSGERVSVIWQRLRLVVVHSTDVYATLDINHSPLANVGTTIELQDFSEKQIQDLALRYELTLDATQLKKLMDLVEGHPYLVHHALKHIAHQGITLDQFLETASTDAGIYSDHLRRLLWRIISRPELATALRKVVTTPNPVRLESIQLFKLVSLGLVKLEGNDARPRCNLYRQYFRDRLSQFEI